MIMMNHTVGVERYKRKLTNELFKYILYVIMCTYMYVSYYKVLLYYRGTCTSVPDMHSPSAKPTNRFELSAKIT
jgi:hypothetical protein